MTKSMKTVSFALALLAAGVSARAQQGGNTLSAGKLSLKSTLGPAFTLGDGTVNDRGRLGPAVGASLGFALRPEYSIEFAYDRLDIGQNIVTESLIGDLVYRIPYRTDYVLFLTAGAGFGRLDERDDLDNFALKLGGGIERYYTDHLSVAGALHYHMISSGSSPFDYTVHAFVPTLQVGFHFGTWGMGL